MSLDIINSEHVSLNDVSVFFELFRNDDSFREFKLRQFEENSDTLSKTENYSYIKERQAKHRMFSCEDKSFIINKIYEVVINSPIIQKTVDRLYLKIKPKLLSGEGVRAFSEHLKYNTNISIDEVKLCKRKNLGEFTRFFIFFYYKLYFFLQFLLKYL